MVFVETSIFSEMLLDIWNDDQYADFQAFLVLNPTAGMTVSGTGGLRKIRWSASGRGKRGGARALYYYDQRLQQIWLFLVYVKAKKADLTEREKVQLRRILERWNDG